MTTTRDKAKDDALKATIRAQLLRDSIGKFVDGEPASPDSPQIPFAHSNVWGEIFTEAMASLEDECSGNIAGEIANQIAPYSQNLSSLLSGIAGAAFNAGYKAGLSTKIGGLK